MAGGHYASQAAPARIWKDVTPSDSVDLPSGCRGLYAGGSGDIAAVGADGVVGTFTVVTGDIVPIAPVRVNATGTTATLIVALY